LKRVFLLALLTSFVSADYYMAQFQPYETITVKSELSGVVERISDKKEFSYIPKSSEVMKLDTIFEDIQIEALSNRVKHTEESLKLRRANLKSKKRVRSISQYEINNETIAVVETKSALQALKMELEIKKASKKKKSFYLRKMYLGEFFVRKGDFVGIGTPLFTYYDFSKGVLDIFVGSDEVEDLRNKKILINGSENKNFKIQKISSVKDSTRISTYKVRLVAKIKNPKNVRFGEIYRVEFAK
jgi:predicted GIY-YIG superfamily endonuclease